MNRSKIFSQLRHVTTTSVSWQNASRAAGERPNTLIHIDEQFRQVPKENRNKQTFLEAIALYKKRSTGIRGHVEFINSCVAHIKDYNLHKDLDVYKAIIDCFPVGPLIPENMWQKMYLHYPNSQIACVKLLDEMEWHQVYPDKEVHDMVARVFGQWTFATRKAKRMFFWLPKLRYSNKYLDKKLLHNRHASLEFAELAKMALQMMSRDKGAVITYAMAKEERNLIVSAQSPLQRRLIRQMPIASTSFFVDGPFSVYVGEHRVNYIQLTTPPTKTLDELDDRWYEHADIEDTKRQRMYDGVFDLVDWGASKVTIHEQLNETILGLAVIEHLEEAAASAWIAHLQVLCEPLREATVVLRIGADAHARKASSSAESSPN